ncbi:guanine nucleotide binding protein, alpha subunit [Amanita rubescens]|nr:guanine nucleotide binding protein, alpha subunit [Amanita rubescens]
MDNSESSRTRSSVDTSDDTLDPLAYVIRPSPTETPAERLVRVLHEAEAKATSDTIDEELEKQAIAERKELKPVKILLLGQSESGKSTTLKNFQLIYEPKAVSRGTCFLACHYTTQHCPIDPPYSRSDRPCRRPRSRIPSTLSPDLLKLKMRLLPLRQVEQRLLRRLALTGSGGGVDNVQLSYTERGRAFLKEIGVNSAVRWKDTFTRGQHHRDRDSVNSEEGIDWDDPEDPGVVLHACAEDMMGLWNDGFVRELLERQGLRLEEVAGFFLDSLERVTSLHYIPTNDDILRARIKTLGVTEHKFKIRTGHTQRDWRVYDVGGHRSQRAAWVPYFDDMDAIIFLAPISCFDQVLSEDPTINRLEDSVNLWKSLVSNKLLKHTNLILYLNKCDILMGKLKAGIKLSDFVLSYGSRSNDYEHTSAYLRRKFAHILQEYSPVRRKFYGHFTAVTDTKSTQVILSCLSDIVLQQHLKQTCLLP